MTGYGKNTRPRDPERDKLVSEHYDMARRIALRVARRLPEWIQKDDVIASALVGLTEAADRYDTTRGEPFVAFAERRIRGAVLDELRRGDIMPRRVRVEARKVGEAVRSLENSLGRPPEDEEVAAKLGVAIEEYRDRLEGLTHVAVVELAERHEELMIDENTPAGIAEKRQLIARMRVGLGKLKERDAQVLSLYYLEDLSYLEIGHVLGVTESRVCQLHSRAIARLRVELVPPEEEDNEQAEAV